MSLLATAAPSGGQQDPNEIPPPRRRPAEYQGHLFTDRQAERRQDELRWRGGLLTPEHQEFKKRTAAEHLERFAASFPKVRAEGMELSMLQPSNAVTWKCIGPTKGVSTYSGMANILDIDSGRISPNGLAVAPDGQTLYLASATGGLWTTSTAGRSNADAAWAWTPLTDSLPTASSTGNIPIGAVALSPSGNTIFIGSGDFTDSFGKGFFRSTDGGATWTETLSANMGLLYQAKYILCILPLSDSVILVGAENGLYRSTDGGVSFGSGTDNRVLGSNGSNPLNHLEAWCVEQVGSSSLNLVATLQDYTQNPATGTAWYSSDGGATWSQASITGTGSTLPANIGRITLKSNKASGNLNVWGIAQISPGRAMLKGLLRSTDGGRNYTYLADPSSPAVLFAAAGASDGGQGNYNQCLAVGQTGTDPSTASIFAATNLGFYRSLDGGTTWTWMSNWYTWPGTPVYAHADKHAAAWSPDGSALYTGSDGGLAVYWDPFRASIPTRLAGNPPLTDTTFLDNRHNEGLSTHLVYHLGSTLAAAPAESNARVTIGLQDNSTRRRTGSPLASSSQFDEAYATGDGFGTLIHRTNGDKFIFTGVGTNLGYSTDGGATYHGASYTLKDPGPFHTRVEPGRADASGDTAYSASSYTLYKTANFGQSWAACAMGGFNSGTAGYIRNFNSSTLDPLKLAIVDATHCWISSDGGSNWTDKGPVYAAGGAEVTLSYIWFDTTNDNILYAASSYAGWGPTIQHLWRSADGGGTWSNIEGGAFPSGHGVNFGGPVHIIQNDPTQSSTLLAGTDFGIYSSTDSGATWTRYGVGLPMVGVRDFYIAPDGSFIRAATYGRGVWETWSVASPPAILAQPTDATAYEGLNTSFGVQATAAFAYQWQVSTGGAFSDLADGAPYSGATTAALAITGATAGMNGYRYQVVVTGSASAVPHTITSNPATLTVVPPPPPSIQTQPGNAVVAVGGSGSFTVQATAVSSYQWQVNAGSGFTNVTNAAPYSGATTATVTITGATAGMSGYLYQVVLTGAAAAVPNTATSTPATLTVVSPPAFTSQPSSALIPVGGNASFSASVTGATSYRWQVKIGASAWTDLSDGGVYSGAITATLAITGAPAGMDGYTFRLIATGNLGLTATSNAVNLAVKLPPAITVQPADASSPINLQAHFTVTATGDSLAYQWQVNPGTGVWANISDVVNYGGFTTASLSAWVSTTMNGYQYRVIVSGSVGTPVTSAAATLTLLCTPGITSQPSNRAIDVGGSTTLSVTATSGLGYIWKVNTGSGVFTTISASAGVYSNWWTSTLTIANATASMNGYVYEVQVIGCGSPAPSTYSTPATLWVGVAPSITAQPANATVGVGGTASFTVTATAATSYQWQVSTGSGFANVANVPPHSGATTPSLTITGATAGMTGYQYQVIATGGVAPAATSNPATLTVNNAPSITGQPVNATVAAGGNANFTVTATGATSYQWQVNSGSGFANVLNGASYSGATTANLTITGATAGMSGNLYQVVVTGSVAPAATSNPASLTVNTPPSITGQPANATVTAGGTTSFTVTASGATSYQWQVSTGAGYVNVVNGAPYSGATTATLTITGATAGMNGNLYQVVVTGAAAPAATSNPATLTVNSPPSITGQPANASVATGGNASFTVTATAATSYQWQVNTGPGYTNLVDGAPYSGATSATLTITGATAGMNGYSYQVVVTGTAAPAATSMPAILTVNMPPSITAHPANATVTAGGNATFSVTATGATSYQWQVDTGSGYGNVANGAPNSGATTAILTITGATAGMNGYLYRVVVTGVAAPAATSNPASLTVNSPPSITGQPVNATVAAGGTATFSVTATGATSYQWQVNTGAGYANVANGAPYSGATTATLTITAATAGMNGYQYQVVVTGTAAPIATSNPATLAVTVAPNITSQPANATIAAGGTATFTVVASGAVSYQWQVNPGTGFAPVANGGPYGGATSATLTITGASASMNGYLFQVIVTGTQAPAATSAPASMTVIVPPAITTPPQSQTVVAGGSANFSVVASGTAPLTYQWRKNAVNVAGQTGSTFALAATVAADAGAYDVVVSNSAGSATSAAANLTVNPAPVGPVITTQPESQSVVAGSPVTFNVAAAGATLTFQWRKNGGDLPGQTGSSLTFASVTLADAGSFDVVVTNPSGSTTSASAVLLVTPAPIPPGITTQPLAQTVVAGAPVTFTVMASGTAPLTYQWRKNTAVLAGQTGASCSIASTVAGDAGLYDVVVSNLAGYMISSPALLVVNPAPVPPSILTPPRSQTVVAGGPAMFSVVASGTAPLGYQWRRNSVNLPGQTGASCTLVSTVSTDAGSYDAMVSNSAGSVVSAAATLTVNPAPVGPSITTQPKDQTATAGSQVMFSVAVSGDPPFTFQWRKNGTAIGGATASNCSLGAVYSDTGAQFTVLVTNVAGSTVSAPAVLTVNPKPLDLNADGVGNVLDLAHFFRLYAPGVPVANSPADLNGDGFVDDLDLVLLLAGM